MIELRNAVLCREVDCQTVYDGRERKEQDGCPRCGSRQRDPLMRWIRSMDREIRPYTWEMFQEVAA
jgi:predicted  nucleic acid-binding Zn-ribbon protein